MPTAEESWVVAHPATTHLQLLFLNPAAIHLFSIKSGNSQTENKSFHTNKFQTGSKNRSAIPLITSWGQRSKSWKNKSTSLPCSPGLLRPSTIRRPIRDNTSMTSRIRGTELQRLGLISGNLSWLRSKESASFSCWAPDTRAATSSKLYASSTRRGKKTT